MFVFPEAFAPYIHAILSIFLPLQPIQCCPSVAGLFRADSKLIVCLSLIENVFVIENSSTIAQLLYHQLRIQYHLLSIKYKLFLLQTCKSAINFYLTCIQLLYHYKAWILCFFGVVHFVEFPFFVRTLFDVFAIAVDNDFNFFIQLNNPFEQSLLFFSCGLRNRKASIY